MRNQRYRKITKLTSYLWIQQHIKHNKNIKKKKKNTLDICGSPNWATSTWMLSSIIFINLLQSYKRETPQLPHTNIEECLRAQVDDHMLCLKRHSWHYYIPRDMEEFTLTYCMWDNIILIFIISLYNIPTKSKLFHNKYGIFVLHSFI